MKDFKPLLFFIVRFIGTYILLTFFYKLYLDKYIPFNNPDPFTKYTSDVTAFILNKYGLLTYSNIATDRPWMLLVINGKVASIVNEGCNAISVAIIFVSFIIAFFTKVKETFLFIVIGLFFIFVMNILRIAIINYIFRFHYEAYGKIAHDYFFPSIIYGSIVILWIVWIKFFVAKKVKNA